MLLFSFEFTTLEVPHSKFEKAVYAIVIFFFCSISLKVVGPKKYLNMLLGCGSVGTSVCIQDSRECSGTNVCYVIPFIINNVEFV